MRRIIQKAFIVITLLLLTLFFMNCTKLQNTEIASSVGDLFKLEGNGSSYGGKPSGLKYRLVPNFKCEDQEAPKAILDIAAQKFSHIDNQTNACQINVEDLTLDKLEHSIYQDDIVGFKEGIFEPLATEFKQVPDNLAEVWCMDYSDSLKLELINYFNRVTQKSYTKIFYSELNADGKSLAFAVPEFTSSRVLTYNSVILFSGTELDLRVLRDQPDQIGRFKSQLKMNVSGKNISKELFCRLGGSVDVSLWPINQAATLPVFDFLVSPSKGSMVYSSTNKDSTTMSLGLVNFASGEDTILDAGIKRNNLTPYNFSIGGKFKFSRDGQALVYQTSSQFIEYNIASKAKAARADIGDVVSFLITPDGQNIVYRMTTTKLPRKDSLFIKNFKTNQVYTIKPSTTICNSGGVSLFSVSSVNNRIIFICGNFPNFEVFTVRLDATDLQQVRLPVEYSNYNLMNLYLVRVEQGPSQAAPLDYGFSDLVYLHANLSTQSNYNTKYFLYKISTNTFLEIPSSSGQIVNKDFYIIPNFSTQYPHGFLILNSADFTSKELTDYITTKNYVFYPGFRWDEAGRFFALKKNPAGKFELKGVEFSSGFTEKTYCPLLQLEDISLSPVVNNTLHMAHRNGNIIYFTKIDLATADCKTLNSIPIPQSFSTLTLGELKLNYKKNYLAFEYLATDQKNNGKEDLYLIPLNGSPPYMVSFPALLNSRVDDFTFTENGEFLYFWGNQSDSNKRNIFKVKVK